MDGDYYTIAIEDFLADVDPQWDKSRFQDPDRLWNKVKACLKNTGGELVPDDKGVKLGGSPSDGGRYATVRIPEPKEHGKSVFAIPTAFEQGKGS